MHIQLGFCFVVLENGKSNEIVRLASRNLLRNLTRELHVDIFKKKCKEIYLEILDYMSSSNWLVNLDSQTDESINHFLN